LLSFGGHTAKTLGVLEGMQRDVGRRRQAEAPAGAARHPARGEDRRGLLRLGSRLVWEWSGPTHIVDVTAHGYVWDDKEYCSLSEIARKITGAGVVRPEVLRPMSGRRGGRDSNLNPDGGSAIDRIRWQRAAVRAAARAA
jgi:hypothetical protein